jgi:polar amino acid transport system substrate-binding protein
MNRPVFQFAIGTAIMVTATAAMAAACTPAHKFNTVSPGVLTIATSTLPPFDSLDVSGNFSGIEADLIKYIAARECLRVQPAMVDPTGQTQYVLAGRADLGAFGWYRSEARSRVLNLSAPLLVERLAIYSKDGSDSIDSLKGRRVGTVQGYLWVPDLRAVLGDSVKLYPTPVALAQDLAAGRIDAAIDSYTKGAYAQSHSNGYPNLTIRPAKPDNRVHASVLPAQTAFLMPKSNDALAKAVDDDIAEARASGEFSRILKQYGVEPSSADVGAPRFVQ